MSDIEDRLSAVTALAAEWRLAAAKAKPLREPGESQLDHGVRIGVWHAVQTASANLDTAIHPSETLRSEE